MTTLFHMQNALFVRRCDAAPWSTAASPLLPQPISTLSSLISSTLSLKLQRLHQQHTRLGFSLSEKLNAETHAPAALPSSARVLTCPTLVVQAKGIVPHTQKQRSFTTMSHPTPHDEDSQPILKPRPRRPFDLSSAPNSAPPTPPSGAMSFPDTLDKLDTSHSYSRTNADGSATPSRTRSFLNLTASTLFGIYQPTGFGTETENPTPWGTGAQTPAESGRGSFDFSKISLPDSAFERDGANGRLRRRRSTQPQVQIRRQATKVSRKKSFKGYFLPLAGRVMALFGTGVLYGLLISHLHDRQKLAPVAVNLDRSRWSYLATWGFIGVLLGEALPWADMLWREDAEDEEGEHAQRRTTGRDVNAWLDVVRSIGAFVGIAFAIRKLPWQSTLQLSLTLALANPAVWYLIDRSPPGFLLSTFVAVTGTAVLLGINPTLVPAPSPRTMFQGQEGLNGTLQALKSEDLVLGIFSQESVGVVTWIASVLFVSSVCFGNIGRRLTPSRA